MAKKLQKDSKYALADADGDGIVTDEEMDRHAMWVRLEKQDKRNRENIEDVRSVINTFELRFESTISSFETRIDKKMTKLDDKLDTLEEGLDKKIERALINPLLGK